MYLKKLSNISQYLNLIKLYKSAFPACERKSLCMILFNYIKKQSDIWIIYNNNLFSGIAITMNRNDLVLLDYFAIDRNKRRIGIGSNALHSLQEIYKDKRFFLEIESVYIESNNTEQRIKRKEFYLNNNMTELKIMVKAFGTEMELLGYNCKVTFEEYYTLYLMNYGKNIAKHFIETTYPN